MATTTARAAAGMRLTVAEYEALGEDPPGERWELDDGELVVSAASRSRHNRIRDALASRMRRAARALAAGVLTETDARLGERTIRRPDVMWYEAKRWKELDHEGWPQPFPDLVIEIVSENDRADQLMKKIGEYLQAGTAAVWVLYPALGLAHRYAATQAVRPPANAAPLAFTAAAGDRLEEREWMPGFSVTLSDVFAAIED